MCIHTLALSARSLSQEALTRREAEGIPFSENLVNTVRSRLLTTNTDLENNDGKNAQARHAKTLTCKRTHSRGDLHIRFGARILAHGT